MATSFGSETTHPRRDHALHNENVCRYLAEASEYGDWVVTTAFYSSLHWLEYLLFPMTVGSSDEAEIISDIDEYRDWSFIDFGSRSKHKIRLDLVKDLYPGIASKYNSLFDTCMTARYRDYRIKQKLVTKAVKNMEAIRLFCEEQKRSAEPE